MKKLYSVIASALLVSAAASAGLPVPYSSNIALNATTFDEGWTVINANNDTKTWTTVSNTSMSPNFCARYTYHNSNEANDFLISPALTLEEGKEYVVLYSVFTQSDIERFTLRVSTGDTETELLAGTQIDFFEKSLSRQQENRTSEVFTAPATGDYYISWHCTSGAYKYYLDINSVKVVENIFAPEAASNLTATVAPERELKISLSWTLPTKSTLGFDLTEDQTIEKVEIYRDGGETAIATLDGTATSFEDTADLGLTSGKHTYQVVVTVAGVASAPASVGPTAYCGPLVATPVPAEFSLNTADDFSLFTVRKGEESGIENTWYMSGTRAYMQTTMGKVADEWIITPPVAVEAAGYYRITFKGFASYANNWVELYMGTSNELADMTTGLGKVLFAQTQNYTAKDYFVDTYITEPGTYYFGLNIAQGADDSVTYGCYLEGASVTASKKLPNPVTELKAVPSNEEITALLTWTCPTTTFSGQAMDASEYNIEIILGDEVIATLPGGTSEYTFTGEEAGGYTLSVRTVLTDGSSLDAVSVKTGWVGPKVVNLPYDVNFNNSGDSTIAMWDAYNAEGNDDTWTYVTAANSWDRSAFQLKTAAAQQLDNAIVSPIAELTEGYYKILYYISGGGSYYGSWDYEAGLVKAGEFGEDRQWLDNAHVSANIKTEYPTAVELQTVITEPGQYQFVLATHPGGQYVSYASYMPKFYQFSIQKVELLPTVATNVTVTPDADFALEATISWTNPTTSNVSGVELQEGDIVKAVIYRNGEELATITEGLVPGETSTFVDNTMEEAGKYAYKVELYTENGRHVAEATELSCWIGPKVVALPYTVDFTNSGDASIAMWEAYNGPGDGKTWTYFQAASTWETSVYQLNVSGVALDNALVSPIANLTEGTYLIRFNISGGYDYYNNSWAFEAGLVKAGEYGENRQWIENAKTSAVIKTSSRTWYEIQTDITEPGEYQFVLAALGEGTNISYANYAPKFYQFSMEQLLLLPTVATNVTVTPGEDYALEATVSWTNPTTSNIGGVELQDGDIVKAVIYRNGEEVGTVTDGLVPGETSTFVDTTLDTPGKHTYKVELYTENGRHKAEAASVTSEWIGGGVSAPYVADSKDAFSAWTIINANNDNNWMTGMDITWQLATDWLTITSTSTEADDWAISPKVQFEEGRIYKIEVTARGAASSSFEATSFDVHIGDNDTADSVGSFQSLGTVSLAADNNTAANPAVAAFYVEAVNAEALVAVQAEEGEGEGEAETDPTENAVVIPAGAKHIGMHANQKCDMTLRKVEVTVAKDLTTGVEDVAVADGVVLDGTTLTFAGKADVMVYTLSGALVAAQHDAEGCADLSTLESGIYLVRVAPANGKAVTLKVAL